MTCSIVMRNGKEEEGGGVIDFFAALIVGQVDGQTRKDKQTNRKTEGQTDRPVRFSVRCHIEYIHSSKLLSPPSVSNLARIVEWGGERDFETIELNFLLVSNVVFCI